MQLFDEGSPKRSHRALIRLALIVGLLTIAASFDAHVTMHREDEVTVLGLGGILAGVTAFFAMLLLAGWRRGVLAGNWPLHASLVLAGVGLAGLSSEWYRAFNTADTFEASALFYATLLLSMLFTLLCALAVLRPVEEVSIANSAWEARRRQR